MKAIEIIKAAEVSLISKTRRGFYTDYFLKTKKGNEFRLESFTRPHQHCLKQDRESLFIIEILSDVSKVDLSIGFFRDGIVYDLKDEGIVSFLKNN